MEPLDTLMALADKFAHARWKDGYTSVESAELYNELSAAITLALAAERRQSEDRLQIALGALADIAVSDDMTLKMARHKAQRIYEQLVDGKANE